MKYILLAVITILLGTNRLNAQQKLTTNPEFKGNNLGFESLSPGVVLPDRWHAFSANKGYKVSTDTLIKHSGKRSLKIESDSSGVRYGVIGTTIAAPVTGKEIEVRAWVKTQDVSYFMGLMLRIDDAESNSLAIENLQKKEIHGTKDWALYKVKLKIPKNAVNIHIGPLLGGTGTIWVDDIQILLDGKDISHLQMEARPLLDTFRYGSNPAASGWVKIKDANLYYETYGSGKPLLLLHGNSQSIYDLRKQVREFSKTYKVIAVDTRGQGRSTDHTTGALTYDLFADDMKQLLDTLKITKIDVVGWSDGGNTGLIMAIKYPGYVNKLAAMGAVLFASDKSVSKKTLNEVRKRIGQLNVKSDVQSKMQVRLYTMLLNEPHLTYDDVRIISSPVLVMAGEHDVVLPSHTQNIAAHIPNAKLVIFKGKTHYISVEDPELYNLTILNFLQ